MFPGILWVELSIMTLVSYIHVYCHYCSCQYSHNTLVSIVFIIPALSPPHMHSPLHTCTLPSTHAHSPPHMHTCTLPSTPALSPPHMHRPSCSQMFVKRPKQIWQCSERSWFEPDHRWCHNGCLYLCTECGENDSSLSCCMWLRNHVECDMLG